MKIDKEVKYTCYFKNPAYPDEEFMVTCAEGGNDAMLKVMGTNFAMRIPLEDALIALQELFDLTKPKARE